MMERGLLAVVLCGSVAGGCTDGVEDAELPRFDSRTRVDSDIADPFGCDMAFGRTMVIDLLEIMQPWEGFDVDGDGDPDNALGFLASFANAGWRESMQAGDSIFLFDFTPWLEFLDEPSDDLGLSFYNAVDADNDPSNNHSGDGEFVVSIEQFDVSCEPTSRFDIVSIESTTVTASSDLWKFFIPDYGTATFANIRLALDVDEDLAGLSGSMGAVWTICGLATSPFPGSTPGSFLDFAGGAFGAVPDIDRDGDGLEQIVFAEARVQSCVDGDGTEIPGPDCACDPRIADGYSIAFRGSAVPAAIVDIRD